MKNRTIVQYCSDLHLEFPENNELLKTWKNSKEADILLLSGDIMPLVDTYYSHPLFDTLSQNYKLVVWVPGNHEFYYCDVDNFPQSFEYKIRENVLLVNNKTIEYREIRFVCTTLWSSISEKNSRIIQQSVSDFNCINYKGKRITSEDFNRFHQQSKEYLIQSLNTKHKKTIVITHHLPSNECNSKQHNKSPINEAFCVDISDLIIASNAKFWIYGHSHFNQKPLLLGNTFLLTNQLGYVSMNEHLSFSKEAYFVI